MKPNVIRISKKQLLRFLVLAGVSVLLSATTHGNGESTTCSLVGLKEFSAKEMKSRLRHTSVFDPPCCAGTLNLKGRLVLDVSVGADGGVMCVDQISGHPLVLTSAIHSISGWKFEPYLENGQSKPFHGRLAIKFHATEQVVTFKVIDEP
jgi:outer membrane biosynthesis protein TonB